MKNAFIDQELTHFLAEDTDVQESRTFGDILAVFLISTYTLSALVISAWSAILYYTGQVANGGPIGFIFKKMLQTMIS